MQSRKLEAPGHIASRQCSSTQDEKKGVGARRQLNDLFAHIEKFEASFTLNDDTRTFAGVGEMTIGSAALLCHPDIGRTPGDWVIRAEGHNPRIPFDTTIVEARLQHMSDFILTQEPNVVEKAEVGHQQPHDRTAEQCAVEAPL